MMKDENALLFRRLQIAGLHTFSFFGYVLHIAIHALMAPGMDKALLEETMRTMNGSSGIAMMIFFTLLTALPAFLCYIFQSKNGWKIIAAVGLISVVLNGLHAGAHIAQGDVMNGVITFIMQVPAAVIAVVLSFKLVKQIEA